MKFYLLYLAYFISVFHVKQVNAAGEPYTFSVEMPSYSVEQNRLKQGKYVFTLSAPDSKCVIDIYSLESYSKKIPLVSGVQAACLVRTEIEKQVLAGFVPYAKEIREGIVYYQTPDYGINKTRIILLPVTLVE